jgi:hypothetical protein
MTASASIEMTGLKEAIRSLNKVEPGLRKEFTANATQIAQPAIQEVQNGYQRKYPCRVCLATGVKVGTRSFLSPLPKQSKV